MAASLLGRLQVRCSRSRPSKVASESQCGIGIIRFFGVLWFHHVEPEHFLSLGTASVDAQSYVRIDIHAESFEVFRCPWKAAPIECPIRVYLPLGFRVKFITFPSSAVTNRPAYDSRAIPNHLLPRDQLVSVPLGVWVATLRHIILTDAFPNCQARPFLS